MHKRDKSIIASQKNSLERLQAQIDKMKAQPSFPVPPPYVATPTAPPQAEVVQIYPQLTKGKALGISGEDEDLLDIWNPTYSMVHQLPMQMFSSPVGLAPQLVHVPWTVSELTHIKSMMPSFRKKANLQICKII